MSEPLYGTEQRTNLGVIERLVTEVFDTGDVDLLDDLIDDSFEFVYPGAESGRAGLKAIVRHNHACFEGWSFELHDRLADADRVVVRWTASGLHVGSFAGERPTHRIVHLSGTSIFELRDGRIVADWVQADMLGFLRQLGVDLREQHRPGDPELRSLLDTLAARLHADEAPPLGPGRAVTDVAFRVGSQTRRYFSTVTTLGTATDITLQEIRIELFHPNQC